MPSSPSVMRRALACLVFTAFTLSAVLANPRPASAAGSGRLWTIVTIVVVACFVLPATPCHPLGKVAGSKPLERPASCDADALTRPVAMTSALEEGTPVHAFGLLPPACGGAPPVAPAAAQPERTANEV